MYVATYGHIKVPQSHNVLTFPFFFVLQPEELEALHSHTFRVKTFKKTKHCSVCKQIIIQDGLICRGQSRNSWVLCVFLV